MSPIPLFPLLLLRDKSSILFQNWLDPSKEIKKQIRSECLLVVRVCRWVGRAWLQCPHLFWTTPVLLCRTWQV